MALHTIDPDIFIDDDFFVLPDKIKLLYLGLIALADDQGRVRNHRQLLKSKLFPSEEMHSQVIGDWLEVLSKARFTILYEVDGKEYIQIRDWWKQQLNNRPTPSKHPAPPDWQDKTGFVYLIHDGELYKIGRTSQPEKRIPQIEYQNGRPCTVLVLIETADYRTLELELHEKFGDKRVRGEWFDLSPEDIAWITSLADTSNEE
jgi:hypothetical protein